MSLFAEFVVMYVAVGAAIAVTTITAGKKAGRTKKEIRSVIIAAWALIAVFVGIFVFCLFGPQWQNG